MSIIGMWETAMKQVPTKVESRMVLRIKKKAA